MMFGYGGAGGGWPVWEIVLMWIGMVAFVGALIWVGYALTTSAARGSRQGRSDETGGHEADAGRVLDERLAHGEIDAAEYQRLRGLIAGDDQAPAGTGSRR